MSVGVGSSTEESDQEVNSRPQEIVGFEDHGNASKKIFSGWVYSLAHKTIPVNLRHTQGKKVG